MKRLSITDAIALHVRFLDAQSREPDGGDTTKPCGLSPMVRENSSRHVGLLSRGRSIRCTTAVMMLLALLCVMWMTLPAVAQVDPYLEEGLKSQRAGKLKEAIEIYTDFLDKNPRSAEALNWRGMTYDDLNELDKALHDFNKAIAVSPGYADAFNNRGEVFRKQKKYNEAANDFRQAIKLDKNFAEPHYNLALINEIQHQYKPAVQEFSEYLKLAPTAEDAEAIKKKIAEIEKAPVRPPSPQQRPGTAAERMKPGEKPAGAPGAAMKPGERPGQRPGFHPPAKAAQPQPAIPGLPKELSGYVTPGMLATIAGLGIVLIAIPLVLYLFFAVMLFLIARKTNTAMPWLAFIPIANLYLMVNIAGKPIWWLALLLLPAITAAFPLLGSVDPTDGLIVTILTALVYLVQMVALLLVCLGISAARGKSVIWGILLFIPCTQPIGLAYLGLSK
jgi:tetratricopeptide (TPR) repeat protein